MMGTRKICLLTICLCFTLSLFITEKIQEMKEEIQETEKIITSIDDWESKTKKEGRTKFLNNFLRKPSMTDISQSFEEAGCYIEEIEEKTSEEERPIIIFHVKGKGKFSQIATAFDMISTKDIWMNVALREATVKEDNIVFQVDVWAYDDETNKGKEISHL